MMAGKHELRAYTPDAAYRFLKEHAGSAGMGQLIGDIVLAYHKQTALDNRLNRIERYILELLDRDKICQR